MENYIEVEIFTRKIENINKEIITFVNLNRRAENVNCLGMKDEARELSTEWLPEILEINQNRKFYSFQKELKKVRKSQESNEKLRGGRRS